MNVLHLLSDWKLTGPSEPVVTLCHQLQQRGHAVTLAYRKPPGNAAKSVAALVKATGVNATDQFHLNHHFSITDNPMDVFQLKRFIQQHEFQIINTNLSHDHILGSLAARWAGTRALVVRTDHQRDTFKPTLLSRFLLRRLTDGLITFSAQARARLIRDFGIAADRVVRVNPALDTARFRPGAGQRVFRRELGFADSDIVVGVVARFQKYRKMDTFFEALRLVVQQNPRVKAMLVGRSSQMEETIRRPIQRLRLTQHVVLAGYLTDRYLDGLASMDMFVFMIAGSDGTARAMREALAMGIPVIANHTGMLPEFIDDGQSGFLFNDNSQDLAEKILKLASDDSLRKAIGTAAATRAQQEFSLEQQVAGVEAFYKSLIQQSSAEVRQ
ncbi:MAG: glycosyltransferase family 4 protein [Verrucomicrobia bacterium]|nr:glycosyltransferase family 4 protein [Verrucomicrobiota bacterium]